MRSSARYSRRVAAPKPPAIEERSWEIFTAYCHKQRTFDEIGSTFHLSPDQVRRIVDEVDAQLGRVRGTGSKLVSLESPLEDLGLSVRTRNALRGVGCNTVEDALRLDLSSTVRGLGRKTRSELLASLERAGFHHESLEEQPVSEFRILERSLERIESRIDRALGAVAKEIRSVRQRLHKKMAARTGKKPAPTAPAPGSAGDYCGDEK
ncbi:MAG: hypothetical protein LAQ69_44010 [Acidobacteriia bacterium]|nr:hypothetical protein [Terriglobia bacterium]